MNRWHFSQPRQTRAGRTPHRRLSLHWLGALALVLATSATAQVAPASVWVAGVASQPKRTFPPNAQRAQMTVLNAHEVSINGTTTRLSPGSRIRATTNALVVSGNLVGQSFVVNLVRDTMGQVHEVWILNAAEAAERRPGMEGTSTSNVSVGTQ